MSPPASGPTVSLQTPAEAFGFGLSCHLAASRVHRAEEIQSNNPYAELDRYLSDRLEWETDILDFWKVSLNLVSFIIILYFLTVGHTE